MEEFAFPPTPGTLCQEDCSHKYAINNDVDVTTLTPEERRNFTERVVFDVCEHDALCVTEQNIFDQVYCLIRGFDSLESVGRFRLLDSLATNLSFLSKSISTLLASPPDEDWAEVVVSHRNALKIYIFFLHWISTQADAASESSKDGAQPASSAASGKGRGRKKVVGQELLTWDWEGQREKLLKAAANVAHVNLWKLFSPRNPEEPFLQLWSDLALRMLASAAAVKNKGNRDSAARILSACALKYQQLETISASLVALLNKHEHLPAPLAEVAQISANLYEDNRLAVEMLREVASVDPAKYEQQQTTDAVGVRSVAGFLPELADRLPRTVAKHISLLMPHLGGKAYPLRSAIVTTVGHLVHKGAEAPAAGADMQGASARLVSKGHLLQTLLERARDQNAYTRARVMQTWADLAEKSAIPISHLVLVMELAVGRLEDKAALVRKAALQLIVALLLHQPFGPSLPIHRFTASLEDLKRNLPEQEPHAAGEADANADAAMAWDAAGGARKDSQATPAVRGADGEHAAAENTEGAPHEGTADNSGQESPAAGADAAREVAAQPGNDDAPTGASPALQQSGVEQLRSLVASLESAVEFIRVLCGAMPVLMQLLASATLTDVQEALNTLIQCHKFEVDGAAGALRKMLPLIFNQEQGVKDVVVDAVVELYLSDQDALAAAQNLVNLAQRATLGELSALEAIVHQLLSRGLLRPLVLKGLWAICARMHTVPTGTGEVRAALSLISMAGADKPELVADHLTDLLKIGFEQQRDPLVTRSACLALQCLQPASDAAAQAALQPVFQALTRVLVASPLPDAGWYSAAEAAMAAIYTLHPAPQALCSAVLQHTAASVLAPPSPGPEATEEGPGVAVLHATVSAAALSRFLFLLGQVALKHLVHVEGLARAIRRKRAHAEKVAADLHAQRLASGDSQPRDDAAAAEEDDIAAQLGVGSVAADTELDALKESAEAEIVAAGNLVGRFAPLVACLCHDRALLSSHPLLRSSALLALTKLMAIDQSFCDANLQLLFTLLQNRAVEASVRSNLVIAVGDLAIRFANLLEPWTEHMYKPLLDSDTGVRKNALMVLTHLILNDMMKVKGHISRMALCLQDTDARIAALAQLFFHELSHKDARGTSPIYNLLPDILSNLSNEPGLPREQFQAIMRHLLGYIGKEKHSDSLVEKLCLRFAATPDAGQWHNLAFCMAQLNYSEKGIKKMMEMFKCYKEALATPEVLAHFQAILGKAKKLSKQSADFKSEAGTTADSAAEAGPSPARASRRSSSRSRQSAGAPPRISQAADAGGSGAKARPSQPAAEFGDENLDSVNVKAEPQAEGPLGVGVKMEPGAQSHAGVVGKRATRRAAA
ncbi:hypothetical protein WJX72_005030 [[Myrmecia] bisecta]|uniref:Condensin-1 complex subunit CAP-D2 n=1 Tax=[Myrmecia] bisecta TaxID=41462 RepID=A0AAW1QQB8_9CHLO